MRQSSCEILIFDLDMIRKDIQGAKGKAYYANQQAKYLNNAKEASSIGDRCLYEYNMQYAEHFARIIAEKFPTIPQQNSDNTQETPVIEPVEQKKLPFRKKRPVIRRQPQIVVEESED